MAVYADTNSVDFHKTTMTDPDRVDVHFYDCGCLLDFTYDIETQNVMVVEFSEDESLNGTIMWAEEFAVFQSEFLDSPRVDDMNNDDPEVMKKVAATLNKVNKTVEFSQWNVQDLTIWWKSVRLN